MWIENWWTQAYRYYVLYLYLLYEYSTELYMIYLPTTATVAVTLSLALGNDMAKYQTNLETLGFIETLECRGIKS